MVLDSDGDVKGMITRSNIYHQVSGKSDLSYENNQRIREAMPVLFQRVDAEGDGILTVEVPPSPFDRCREDHSLILICSRAWQEWRRAQSEFGLDEVLEVADTDEVDTLEANLPKAITGVTPRAPKASSMRNRGERPGLG